MAFTVHTFWKILFKKYNGVSHPFPPFLGFVHVEKGIMGCKLCFFLFVGGFFVFTVEMVYFLPCRRLLWGPVSTYLFKILGQIVLKQWKNYFLFHRFLFSPILNGIWFFKIFSWRLTQSNLNTLNSPSHWCNQGMFCWRIESEWSPIVLELQTCAAWDMVVSSVCDCPVCWRMGGGKATFPFCLHTSSPLFWEERLKACSCCQERAGAGCYRALGVRGCPWHIPCHLWGCGSPCAPQLAPALLPALQRARTPVCSRHPTLLWLMGPCCQWLWQVFCCVVGFEPWASPLFLALLHRGKVFLWC